jgi:hypothetical protein
MASLGNLRPSPCTLHGLGYLALSTLLATWAAILTLKATGGELALPLDDSYIYLQYARGAARGEPFTYQPGMPATRGATSFLYPLLLAPWARFLSPSGLVWASWGLGIPAMAGAALAVDRWASRRLGGPAAWAVGLLTLLSGHFLWGGVSGMDIALYAVVLASCVASVPWYLDAPDPARGRRRLLGVGGCLFLLGLARPEGLLLGGVIALGIMGARSAPHPRRTRAILLAAPTLAALLIFGTGLAATGSLAGNTFASKSIWSEPRPDIFDKLLARIPRVLGRTTAVLVSDFESAAYRHGTGWILTFLLAGGALAGGVFAWTRRGRAPERTLVLVLAAALATGLLPIVYDLQHYRYQIPYLPLVTLLVVTGWWRLLGTRPLPVRMAPLLLIGVLLLPGLVRYAHLAARNSANIHDQQIALGRWIDVNLPPSAIVAVNDAGAIPYYADRRVVDLLGLVTNGATRPARAGQGSLYEWLASLPPGERPTHFAVFPAWWPYLRHAGILGRKLAQFTLADNTISGSNVKSVYEADWSRAGGAERPWIRAELLDLWGFEIVDELNVAELRSQDAHGYEAFETWRDKLRAFPAAGAPDLVLIEGGRQPTRGERFRMACRPGVPAVLVMRTEAFRSFRLEVRIDGRYLGTWEIPEAPLVWSEPVFEIPGDAISGESARFELRQPDDEEPYPVFRYWLLQ